MTLDFNQIIERIKNPVNADIIARAIDIREKHVLHIEGQGVDEFIKRIEGFESEAQEKIRKKYTGTPTKPIYATVLNNIEKIFSARGGSRYYDFENKDTELLFEEKLNAVGEGMSIKEWMSKVWKDKINTDSSGLAFIEISKIGEPYITYKSIVDIYDMEFSGIDVGYVIFNPIKKDDEYYYRVVDDAYDYMIRRKGDDFTIVEDDTYKNFFFKTPAVIFSSNKDDISEAKTSYVYKSMTLADDYLTDASIHKLYKKKHGYPVFAMRSVACSNPDCNSGYLSNGNKCTECGGTGMTLKKDVSDILEMPVIEDKDQPDPMNPVAVYVHAPTEISQEQREILNELEEKIYTTIWGVNNIDKGKNIKTATGEILNIQPIIDKLNDISANAEQEEAKLTNLFGYFYYPNEYRGCSINYGRNYVIRNENEAWGIYSDARIKGMSEAGLNILYEDYIRTKYERDTLNLNRQLKLMQIEPFLHQTIKELRDLGIFGKDFDIKLYFNELINRYEKEIKPVVISDNDKIREKLKEYINLKQKDYENSNSTCIEQ